MMGPPSWRSRITSCNIYLYNKNISADHSLIDMSLCISLYVGKYLPCPKPAKMPSIAWPKNKKDEQIRNFIAEVESAIGSATWETKCKLPK